MYCYFGPQLSLFWRYKLVHVNQNASHAISQHHFSLLEATAWQWAHIELALFLRTFHSYINKQMHFSTGSSLGTTAAYSLSWGLFSN